MIGKYAMMFLLSVVLAFGTGTLFAMGAKGDKMDAKEKSMMPDDHSMGTADKSMKHDEGMKTEMKTEMKQEEMKKKDDGMMHETSKETGGSMDKMDTMK